MAEGEHERAVREHRGAGGEHERASREQRGAQRKHMAEMGLRAGAMPRFSIFETRGYYIYIYVTSTNIITSLGQNPNLRHACLLSVPLRALSFRYPEDRVRRKNLHSAISSRYQTLQ